MPRIAFVADSQVDEHSRLAEHDRVMSFVVEDAGRDGRRCSLLLNGGDVYERRSTVCERAAVRNWIELAVVNDLEVAIVAGNHEALGEVAELGDVAFATETPCVRVFGDGADAVAVAFLPWPRRERLHEWLGRPASRAEVDTIAIELLRDVIRGLGAELAKVAPEIPRVLVGHVELAGYRTDPDQPAHVGSGMQLSIEDLMLAGADVVLLGHIHMPQEWEGVRLHAGEVLVSEALPPAEQVVGVPVIYAGSPRRTAYAKGELVPKGYVVVEFDGRRLVNWERVPTPSTPMVLVEASWGPASGLFLDGAPSVPTGAEVRLRYEVAADRREAARVAALDQQRAWISAGAAEVKLDEVVLPVTAARAPEVARAVGTWPKLEALAKARGEELSCGRKERLAGKVARLEEEVAR